MLASFAELDVRITLLRQVQVNHGRGDVGQIIAAIERQLNFVLTLKLFEFLRVAAFHPAGGG